MGPPAEHRSRARFSGHPQVWFEPLPVTPESLPLSATTLVLVATPALVYVRACGRSFPVSTEDLASARWPLAGGLGGSCPRSAPRGLTASRGRARRIMRAGG